MVCTSPPSIWIHLNGAQRLGEFFLTITCWKSIPLNGSIWALDFSHFHAGRLSNLFKKTSKAECYRYHDEFRVCTVAKHP